MDDAIDDRDGVVAIIGEAAHHGNDGRWRTRVRRAARVLPGAVDPLVTPRFAQTVWPSSPRAPAATLLARPRRGRRADARRAA
jgi:hypothetical protein